MHCFFEEGIVKMTISGTVHKGVFLFVLLWGTIIFGILDVESATSNYFGSAAITSPASLGNVDLAFHLVVNTDGSISAAESYVILDKTLLFPQTGTLPDGTPVGPNIQAGSTFSGLNLNLAVEPFLTTVGGKEVTRKIVLTGTATNARKDTITGTYRETMTGYLSVPVVVEGTFTMTSPVAITPGEFACKLLDRVSPIGELTLEEIKAGGEDPNVVEFEDLACATFFHHNPVQGVRVTDATLRDAILDYEAYLTAEQP